MGMTVTPLGVGEAFDADETNSSVLVRSGGFTLLIDCGHSVVAPLWRACPEPDAIDAIYLTHLHCDHVLGLPPILDRWAYEGRRGPLTILTAQAGPQIVRDLCAAVRIPLDGRSKFPITLCAPEGRLGPFALATALTRHGAPNEAIRLEAEGRRFAYSGDGRPTDASRALYDGVDLLLHECWSPEASDNPSHCDLPSLRRLAGPARIGLYHVRAGSRDTLKKAVAGDSRLFVPEAGDVLEV
jgi:ribonuclease BN (tRNA processing enzyme)